MSSNVILDVDDELRHFWACTILILSCSIAATSWPSGLLTLSASLAPTSCVYAHVCFAHCVCAAMCECARLQSPQRHLSLSATIYNVFVYVPSVISSHVSVFTPLACMDVRTSTSVQKCCARLKTIPLRPTHIKTYSHLPALWLSPARVEWLNVLKALAKQRSSSAPWFDIKCLASLKSAVYIQLHLRAYVPTPLQPPPFVIQLF